MTDTKSTIQPELTPLYIGTGVEVSGMIRHVGPVAEKAIVLGTLLGDLEWNGILQVPHGGKVVVQQSMRCREMIVNGEISSANEEVVIETGLLRLGEKAIITVATVSVPPGGLEQARGSVINAKLRMTGDHPFASPVPAESAEVGQPAMQRPVLTAVSTSNQQHLPEPSESPELVQVETRSQGAMAA
jgi:hypothetical protein